MSRPAYYRRKGNDGSSGTVTRTLFPAISDRLYAAVMGPELASRPPRPKPKR